MSVTTRVFAGAIALMAVTGCGGPAAAQQSQDVTACVNKEKASPDIQIGGCTAAIQSGQWKSEGLAWAFNNRGDAYYKKGQYDRAIQDYDQAIKLNPSNAIAFSARGVAYGNKGQYDCAIQDHDQAIKLNPNYADAFYNRGVAYAKKNDLQRALADFKKFSELAPSDPDGPKAVERVTKALSGR